MRIKYAKQPGKVVSTSAGKGRLAAAKVLLRMGFYNDSISREAAQSKNEIHRDCSYAVYKRYCMTVSLLRMQILARAYSPRAKHGFFPHELN